MRPSRLEPWLLLSQLEYYACVENEERGVDALPWLWLSCFRNGNYSRTFGRWCGSKPAVVRDQVLQHLDTLKGIRGVEELKARVADGSSGETMVLINACKCMHVIKNWVFLKRSSLSWILRRHWSCGLAVLDMCNRNWLHKMSWGNLGIDSVWLISTHMVSWEDFWGLRSFLLGEATGPQTFAQRWRPV